MAMRAAHRSKFAALTTQYEWKLEWDEKTNKQQITIIIVTWYLNEKASSDLNTFLCVKTHQFRSPLLIMDKIKDVIVNRKSEL